MSPKAPGFWASVEPATPILPTEPYPTTLGPQGTVHIHWNQGGSGVDRGGRQIWNSVVPLDGYITALAGQRSME